MNVIAFPGARVARVDQFRTVPSSRLPGYLEVQKLEGGIWRAKAVAENAARAAEIVETLRRNNADLR